MINLHKKKIEDKRLETKKTKKVNEDDEVEIEEEEDMECEKQSLLIRKRKDEDEALRSKKRATKPKGKE